MADGDIVYGQPNGYYRKAYEAICEGRSDSTRLLMDALLKHIRRIGDVPVIFAKRSGEYLAKELEKKERNWHNLSQGLDNRSLAKVIKIYPFVGNEVRNCRYQQSNSISDQIAVCDFCILMKVSEIF
jgi:hypothetical protein